MQAPQHKMNVALFTCLPGGPEDPKETQRYVNLHCKELGWLDMLLGEWLPNQAMSGGGLDLYLCGMDEVTTFAKDLLSDMDIKDFRKWVGMYLNLALSTKKEHWDGKPKYGSDYFDAADNGLIKDDVSIRLDTFLRHWFYDKDTLRRFYLSPEEVEAHESQGGTFDVYADISLDLGWWGGNEGEETDLEEEAKPLPPWTKFGVPMFPKPKSGYSDRDRMLAALVCF